MTKRVSIMAILFELLFYLAACCQNKINQEVSRNRYDSLSQVLVQIGYQDQKYRNQMDSVVAKYGGDSPEMKLLLRKMASRDSINFLSVSAIIDNYGWIGPTFIGTQANTILFLVIQHAPLKAQEKYLPVMRDAVKSGNANGASLALLEDRVALGNGRKQIYGSQISWNMKTNEYYVLPLDDPDNVDLRRKDMGLGPIGDYVKNCCNQVWNVGEYKRSPHANEAIPKKRK